MTKEVKMNDLKTVPIKELMEDDSKKGDFDTSSVFEGLKMMEFNDLPAKVKEKLVKMISRISEKSYRRGAQQAIALLERDALLYTTEVALHGWRYEKTLKNSPGLDGFLTSSRERLEIETHLREVGLF